MSKSSGNNNKRGGITRSSTWAMENLAGSDKLRLGIPDTILFKDGAPQAWLFTSKAGDVLNKRSLRKSSIKERFTRLFATNPNNPQQRLATVRFMDGTVRNVGRGSFKEMMAKFPATEPGIVSLQCYMQGKGAAGTVYRNSYRIVNDKGLVVTGTRSFTTLSPDQVTAPLSSWTEREIKFEPCKASNINTALDAVTLSIVRYLEGDQDRPTRILHAQCDYIVDATGQIWLTWIGETTVAVDEAAQDLRLANVAREGPRGRADFLGQQTSLVMQRDFGGPPAPTKKTRRRSDSATTFGEGGSGGDIGEVVDRAAEVIELPREAVGTGGSGGIANALFRAEANKKTQHAAALGRSASCPTAVARQQQQYPRAAGEGTTLSTMTVGVRTGEAWEVGGNGGRAADTSRYPSSFVCAGDYCAVRVLDPREDADDPRKQRDPRGSLLDPEISSQNFFTEVASRLFSGQELSALRRDANFRRQVEDGLVTEVEPTTATRADEGGVGGGGGKQESPASGPTGAGGGIGTSRPKRDPIAGGLKDRDPRNWFEVSLKSVSLARKERNRRRSSSKEDAAAIGLAGPGSGGLKANRSTSDIVPPRQDGGKVGAAGGGGESGRAGGGGESLGIVSRMLQETEASTMRKHARKREDEIVAGGAQNFYKPVRVCEPCFRVYALLDMARETITRQEALAAEASAACDRSDSSLIASRWATSRRLELAGNGDDGEREENDPASLISDEIQFHRVNNATARRTAGTLSAAARPRSQGDDAHTRESRKRPLPRGAGGGGGRMAVTWRGRLQGEDRGKGGGHEKKEPGLMSSGKKFEDLDNYLRGCAAVAGAKREKRKRGRRRLGGSSLGGGGSGGGGNSVETAGGSSLSLAEEYEEEEEDKGSGEGLFHARVILGEADPESAKRVKEILDNAGYMV
ncbi:unnamed protein product, partial [Laminaria digitata]